MFLVNSRTARVCGTLAVSACLATVMACGDKSNPANPSRPSPSPSNPSTLTPTPPPATPAPSPTPTPGGGLASNACKQLTPSSGTERNCRTEGAVYAAALSQAISSVNPEYMEGNEIVYIGGYLQDIVKSLDAQGICAVPEGDNLFMRAVGDSFNEYYDVITSRGDTAQRYTNTCRPAVTTPETPGPRGQADPSCRLAPSFETVCFEDTSPVFDAEVREAIEAVIAADRARPTPVIFDFDRTLPGTSEGYKILDATAYHEGVVQHLRKLGFCAYYDGEDIQVKNSNRFSAHWDIYKAEGFRIQLFTAICRDAAF